MFKFLPTNSSLLITFRETTNGMISLRFASDHFLTPGTPQEKKIMSHRHHSNALPECSWGISTLCFGHEQVSFSSILNISVDFLASTYFSWVFLARLYYRSAMSSRHLHKRSLSRESHRASSSPKRKKFSDKQDKLDIILTSLTDLKSDVAACNSMETRRVLHEAWSSPSLAQR